MISGDLITSKDLSIEAERGLFTKPSDIFLFRANRNNISLKEICNKTLGRFIFNKNCALFTSVFNACKEISRFILASYFNAIILKGIIYNW